MAIVGAFPTTLQNGTTEDATQVMSLFSFIQSQINSNACPATAGTSILKGNGSGGTTSAISGTDYAAPNVAQSQTGVWCGTAGGTANAITLTPSPAITAYAAGQRFAFLAASTNTGAATANVNGLGPVAVAANAGDIQSGKAYSIVYDGTQFQPSGAGSVLTSGNQSVAGLKTFLSSPSVPAPSASGDAAPKSYVDALVPSGAVLPFAMSTAPTGWLECDGSAISRATYASLFAAIGTTFGAGDGSTTFNLPDLRGYFVRGWADTGSIDPGRAFGSTQADNIRSSSFGQILADLANSGSGAFSVFNQTSRYSVTPDGAGGQQYQSIKLGSGSDTHPYNVALMYCIKT